MCANLDKLVKAFRIIDTLAAEARRELDNGGDRKVACGKLAAIQLKAQAGMQQLQPEPVDSFIATSPELLGIAIEVVRLHTVGESDG